MSDPLIVGASLNRKVWILTKKELFRNPLLANLIRKYHAIPIDRDRFDRDSLSTVIKKLKAKESMLIFPQGTRSRDNTLELKVGLAFIAMHAGASIIPIYLGGSNHLLATMIRRKKLELFIGPPIMVSGINESDNRKRDYRIISSMVLEEIRMLKGE